MSKATDIEILYEKFMDFWISERDRGLLNLKDDDIEIARVFFLAGRAVGRDEAEKIISNQ